MTDNTSPSPTSIGTPPSLDTLPDFDGTNFSMSEMERYTNAAEAAKAPGSSNEASLVEAAGDADEASEGEEEAPSETTAGAVEEAPEDNTVKEALKTPIITAKHDNTTIDVPEDAVFQVKVNGKMVDVTLKDLQTGYSGRTEVSRRFTELDKERKELTQARETHNHEIARINANFEMMQMLGPDEFIHHLAVMKGADPQALLGEMVHNTIQLVNEMQDLTPAQRKLYLENRQYKIEKKLQEIGHKQGEKIQQEQEQRRFAEERKTQVLAERDSLGLEHNEFLDAISEVADLVEKGELQGTWDEYDILHFAREKKILHSLESSAQSVLQSPVPTNILKAVRKAIAVEENASESYLTQSEVNTIATRLFNMHKAKTQKPLTKAPPKAVATSEKARSNNAEGSDNQSLNDLMRTLGLA